MGITRQQALDCFQSDDLIGLGMEADAVRRTLHPEGVVTYVIDRTLCATAPDLDHRLDEALDLDATGLNLQGHLPSLAAWETLLRQMRASHPTLWRHGLSATEIAATAAHAGLSVRDTLARLQAAGLQSLAGHDAGLLGDNAATAQHRCTAEAWLATHRAAHALGLPSSATLLFGAGESFADRVAHLEALRQLQEETGGFLAFRPLAAPLPNFEEATAVEYLKTLAIARMVLDTIPNLEADWPGQGLKVLQMALRFGANDVGTTFPGDSLPAPGGTTEEDLRRIIRGAGLGPVQRDPPYRTCLLT